MISYHIHINPIANNKLLVQPLVRLYFASINIQSRPVEKYFAVIRTGVRYGQSYRRVNEIIEN